MTLPQKSAAELTISGCLTEESHAFSHVQHAKSRLAVDLWHLSIQPLPTVIWQG